MKGKNQRIEVTEDGGVSGTDRSTGAPRAAVGDGAIPRMRLSAVARKLLDQDALRRAVAQREPGAIDLAHDRPAPGDLGDARRFSKPHLTNALAELCAPCEFADQTQRARRQLAEGQKNRCKRTIHSDPDNETRFQ